MASLEMVRKQSMLGFREYFDSIRHTVMDT